MRNYNLFVDDVRNPNWNECLESGIDLDSQPWIIARSTDEAIRIVSRRNRMPDRLALDHDLGMTPEGLEDNIMRFLKWLVYEFWDGKSSLPEYTIHSANPVGKENIRSFLESWKKIAAENS